MNTEAPSRNFEPFFQGIRAILNSWDALRLSVQNGWAGDIDTTEGKLECLYLDICDTFKADKFEEDLVDLVESHVSEEFKMLLEDGSFEQICSEMITLFYEWRSGRTELLAKVIETAGHRRPLGYVLRLEDGGPTSAPPPPTACDSPAPPAVAPPAAASTTTATTVTATTDEPPAAIPLDVAPLQEALPSATPEDDEWITPSRGRKNRRR
eukprot:gnl/Trimastix_PCT/1581.p1 GENE.gnl/Trimastix_PCT/1581~~gnl/Trimastix_PCT/1581.p1  ORF type:complete len:210 (-),score=32.44 gnl/Trimastix_PCT/1581:114-743(-)